jgi:hypothetical protein
MATPIEQIFSALAEIRARLAAVPPVSDGERNSLKTAYDQLIAKADAINSVEVGDAAKRVGSAAEQLEQIVRSGRTDPIEIYLKKLRQAVTSLSATQPRSEDLKPSPATRATANSPTDRSLNAGLSGGGMSLPLTQAGLETACRMLGVRAAEVWAIVFTETDPPYCGFLKDGRPQILYERHIFHRLTKGAFSDTHPSISDPNQGNYGPSGAHQYQRLSEAMRLDETAALQSATWGIGQTLGTNYRRVGFASPQEMVKQMCYSEDEQLLAAVREISTSDIAGALAAHVIFPRKNGQG